MEHLLFHPVGFIAAFFLLENAPEQTLSPAVLIASLYVLSLAAFLGLSGNFSRTTTASYAAYVRDERDFRYLADWLAGNCRLAL